MNTQRKALIKVGNNPEYAICIPAQHMAAVSAALAEAVVVKAECSYDPSKGWKCADEEIALVSVAGDFMDPVDPRITASEKEAEAKDALWWKEYNEHNDAKRRITELAAQVEALTRAGTCHATVEVDDEPL